MNARTLKRVDLNALLLGSSRTNEQRTEYDRALARIDAEIAKALALRPASVIDSIAPTCTCGRELYSDTGMCTRCHEDAVYERQRSLGRSVD